MYFSSVCTCTVKNASTAATQKIRGSRGKHPEMAGQNFAKEAQYNNQPFVAVTAPPLLLPPSIRQTQQTFYNASARTYGTPPQVARPSF